MRWWRSIELRLTAWFCLMLVASFLLFGGALWWSVRFAVSAAVDDALSERIDKLIATVEADADGPDEVEEDLIELILASPEGELARVRDARGRQVFPTLDDGEGYRTAELEPERYRALERRVSLLGRDYDVLLVSSLESLERVAVQLARFLWIAAPLAILLSAMGGLYIARRALRPVDAITSTAADITVQMLSSRLPVSETGDALERLSRTFNEMLGRLEASVTRIEQFTADASHELRTPLSVIRTTSELALRHGRDEADYRRDLQEIHEEACRLSDLIDVLLTLSREGTDAQSVPMSDVDLAELAEDVCRHVRPDADAKGLELSFAAAERPIPITGNGPALRTLLSSLLANALAHTSEGRITVSVLPEMDTVRLVVADTGEGIAEEALGRIFDRFYRADAARSRESGRLGLGLSIAKRIAELHRAAIGVESRLGAGSVLSVAFPRRTPS